MIGSYAVQLIQGVLRGLGSAQLGYFGGQIFKCQYFRVYKHMNMEYGKVNIYYVMLGNF